MSFSTIKFILHLKCTLHYEQWQITLEQENIWNCSLFKVTGQHPRCQCKEAVTQQEYIEKE